MTRARQLADMISDGVIGTTELADDVITPVKLDETGSYTIAQLDVNGTLTSDGLTVDGVAKIQGTATGLVINETDTTDLNTYFNANSGDFNLMTTNDAFTSFTTRLNVDHSTGDISFYEDQGTTAKLTWSASTESLRFDSATLQEINGTDPFLSGNAYWDGSNWKYATSTDATNYYQAGRQHIWRSAASGTAGNNITWSESMRITSVGNVGINSSSPTAYGLTVGSTASGSYPIQIHAGGSSTAPTAGTFSTLSNNNHGDLFIASNAYVNTNHNPVIINTHGSMGATGIMIGGNDNETIRFFVQDASVTAGTEVTTAEAMRLTSAGNLIVGGTTDGASSSITLQNDGDIRGVLASGAGGDSLISAISGVSNGYQITVDTSNNQTYKWYNGSAQSMTLNSSGDLLVGKTSSNFGNDGGEIKSNGQITATASNAAAMQMNRRSSDGTLLNFAKDGSTVGSIGVEGGDLVIGTGTNCGLQFNDGNAAIRPFNIASNAAVDNAVDLGVSGTRFKDLYLSGGVYLGGTAATNKLDDYEDGSWTVNLYKGGSALAVTNRYGYYRRVGDLLHISFYWLNSSITTTGTSVYSIQGMPFNLIALANGAYQFCPVGYNSIDSNNVHRWQANSSTELQMYGAGGATNVSSGLLEFSGAGVFRI